jgi:hypothetical protein
VRRATEIRSGVRDLIAAGRIRYLDQIGIERETGFGWEFDRRTGEYQKPRRENPLDYED